MCELVLRTSKNHDSYFYWLSEFIYNSITSSVRRKMKVNAFYIYKFLMYDLFRHLQVISIIHFPITFILM